MNVGGEGGSSSQDFDLNLAPIIDAFVVLITYLLVSASFISLSILDVGVSANGEASAEQTAPVDPPVNMEILVTVARTANIKITGGAENLNLDFPVAADATGAWDMKSLLSQVDELKLRWPTLADTSLSAEPGVKYKELIKVIESLKKSMPKIYIAG